MAIRRYGASTLIVGMNADGRLTIPATARRQLALEGEAQFSVEVVPEGLLLRPVLVLPQEDAWAYTSEHRHLLRKAHRDSQEGRVRQLSESDLERLANA